MNTRCKPGDLAIVVHADYPANLGRIVQVIAPDVGASFVRFHERGTIWWVTCPSRMTWSMGNQVFQRRAGPVPDDCLLPIRDLPDQDATDDDLENHQPAIDHDLIEEALTS